LEDFHNLNSQAVDWDFLYKIIALKWHCYFFHSVQFHLYVNVILSVLVMVQTNKVDVLNLVLYYACIAHTCKNAVTSDATGHLTWPSIEQCGLILCYCLQDIQLGGLGILHEHCQLDIEDNEVYVTPLAKTGYVATSWRQPSQNILE